jgi:hypothetical protein
MNSRRLMPNMGGPLPGAAADHTSYAGGLTRHELAGDGVSRSLEQT